MRIKNLRGVSEVPFKKQLDSFTLKTSKNHLIRNFLRNGRLRVKVPYGCPRGGEAKTFCGKVLTFLQEHIETLRFGVRFRSRVKVRFRSRVKVRVR